MNQFPGAGSPMSEVVLTILAIVVLVIFGWAIYAFIIAIFQMIFSRGEQEKVKKAWNNIRYMIIWIILSIFFLFILPFILKRMEIDWYEKYTAKNIFEKASELIEIVFDTTENSLNQENSNYWDSYDWWL